MRLIKGQFIFSPAAETGGALNDGVVRVRLGYKHPNTGSNIAWFGDVLIKKVTVR